MLPAVDKLVEMGIVDPERIGVIGSSYGGYTVYALLAQAKRFKCAIAQAGISDLVSKYGTFDARKRYNRSGGTGSANWSEGSQGRMGGPTLGRSFPMD